MEINELEFSKLKFVCHLFYIYCAEFHQEIAGSVLMKYMKFLICDTQRPRIHSAPNLARNIMKRGPVWRDQFIRPVPPAGRDSSPCYQMARAKLDDGSAEQGSGRFLLQSGDQCLVGDLYRPGRVLTVQGGASASTERGH
ncbi:hypothetical protein RRG08_043436 [Elysia crispata]|uniref:Uncharacterized protein n=1 Tax=Elysia crispata TaxID=231223 RepID=A0AAE0YKS1_9GAST|nr:hypothetical protein RRG08_043436 [Elysia crispata]